jgi:hypothetical protein
MWTGVLLLSLVAAAPFSRSAVQGPAAAECTSWQACRDQVEAALAAESFDRALDLAWRTAQRGPKDDPALMFLLARAQAMGGRPHDALVMVRRLAEKGVASEALTHPDLARTRELSGWAEVELLVARANSGVKATPGEKAPAAPASAPLDAAATTAPSGSADADPSATTAHRRSPAGTPARTGAASVVANANLKEESLRFSADKFVAAGLAYDAVSRRFVLGDERGRKVRVVGEGLDHAVDLVRAESAGFAEVRALAIDPRRGDLWVASADPTRNAGTLHRLQLISGRPLQAVPIGEPTAPVHPVDVAVADSGLVFILDRSGRILRARPGGKATELIAETGVEPAFSLALAAGDTVAYVTHAGGIVRVDLGARRTAQVSSAAELPLTAVERLRAHRDGFIALQRLPDGHRRLLRVELSRNGRAVRHATAYDVRVEGGLGAPALTVSGDEVALVTGGLETSGESGASPSIGPPAELVVRRFRLR